MIDFLRDNWEGILTGASATIVVIFFTKILFFIKAIPNYLFKIKIEKEIKKKLNSIKKEVSLPIIPDIEIKISSIPENPQEYEDKIIIFAKKEKKPKVLANIVSIFLDHSFLQDSKRHIDNKLCLSIKYTVGKEILTQYRQLNELKKASQEALRYFDRIMSESLENPDIVELIEKEELMIRKKLFKTVFLQEIYALGDRLIGKIPKQQCKEESIRFVDFLYDISRKEDYVKEKQQDPPLLFKGNFIRTAIVLVKSPDKKNLVPHLKAIKKNIEEGVLSNYILGLGKHVEPIKKDMVNWLKSKQFNEWFPEWKVQNIIEFKMTSQSMEDIAGICVIYTNIRWLSSI